MCESVHKHQLTDSCNTLLDLVCGRKFCCLLSIKKGDLSWGSRQGFACCQQWFAEELPVVSSWDSCTPVIIITIFNSNSVLLRRVSNKPFGGWRDTISSSTCINFCNSYKPSWGWKGKRVNRSCGVAVPPAASLSLLLFQREQELNHDCFCAAEAGYPLAYWIQRWSFILCPLNGNSMMWAWKEWNSMLRETGLKGENSWLQGLSRSAPSASLGGFVFSSEHLGSCSTAPQLWAGKWNNCKESVPSSWNKLHSLWEMKAKAELQNKLEVLRCRSAEWNHSIESDLEQSPEKNPAVMTNPFLMCVVVGKITLKDHFSLCIGYSSLPSF